MPEIITKAEFARRKNVNQSKVGKAIANGRIVARKDGKIDWSTQGKAWEDNRDQSQIREHNAPDGVENDGSIAKVRLARETYATRIKKIEHDRLVGRLIDQEQVRAAIFKFNRYVRDSILAIPDRVAASFSAAAMAYITPILARHVSKEKVSEIMADIKSEAIARIAHTAWEKESRTVMEELNNGKVIER